MAPKVTATDAPAEHGTKSNKPALYNSNLINIPINKSAKYIDLHFLAVAIVKVL